MKKLIKVLCISQLVGCATYGLPQGTPSAMIRFTSDTPVQFSLPCSKDAALVKRGLVHNQFWKEQSEIKMYGTRPDKNSDVMERLIPAERELAFMFGSTSAGTDGTIGDKTIYACMVTMSFIPRTGEQYEATYRWIGDHCTVKLYRLSASNEEIRKTELKALLFPGRHCPYE